MAVTLVPPGNEVTAAVVSADRTWEERPGEVFRAASVTKTFVAATVLLLVERGDLELDAPVRTLLSPDLGAALEDGGYDPHGITVEHLLAHRSGLPDHSILESYLTAVRADPERVWTRADQLNLALDETGPLCPAGAAVHYSDTGYVLLGDVLERTSGRALGDLVRELLDLPARTPSTYWEAEPVPDPRFPQRVDGVDVWRIHRTVDTFGGGGLVTTARDLAVFGRDLLTGRVLATASLERMLEQQLGIVPAPGPARIWGHLGFWGTAMLASRDGIGIGVAVSPAPISGGTDPGAVALSVHDAFAGGRL
jgi:D-alanyl-D-alanine carboxypeptidase